MNRKIVPYILISVIHLVAILLHFEAVVFCTKPLLMIALFYYFYLSVNDSPIKRIITIALAGAFGGDVLLMFPHKSIYFFLGGLFCFLITQASYAFTFFKLKQKDVGISFRAILLPILFFFMMMSAIWSGLEGTLRAPVVVYGLTIATMVSLAMQLKGSIKWEAALMIILGAVLFMGSDSLIAISKFTDRMANVTQTDFLIMLTYILGQAGIVIGLAEALLEDLSRTRFGRAKKITSPIS